MMNRLILVNSVFRRIFTKQTPIFRTRHSPKFIVNQYRLFYLSTSYAFLKGSDKANFLENFDLKLMEACAEGETTIVQLMDFLKSNIDEIANAYKNCLKKQIEIIDAGSKAGATSSIWDELPEHRTLANDLNEQLQSFVTTINILGEIATNKTLRYITEQKTQFQLLREKHKELHTIVKKHLEEIKSLQATVLVKSRRSIENSILL